MDNECYVVGFSIFECQFLLGSFVLLFCVHTTKRETKHKLQNPWYIYEGSQNIPTLISELNGWHFSWRVLDSINSSFFWFLAFWITFKAPSWKLNVHLQVSRIHFNRHSLSKVLYNTIELNNTLNLKIL